MAWFLACADPRVVDGCLGSYDETGAGSQLAEGYHRVDERGRVVEELRHDYAKGLQGRVERTWSGGLLVEEDHDLDDDGVVDEANTYTYDAGRLVHTETVRSVGTTSVFWEYDDEGNPVWATTWLGPTFTSSIEWVWDAGRTTSREVRDAEDRVLFRSDYTYSAPPPALDHTEIERRSVGVLQESRFVRRYGPNGQLVESGSSSAARRRARRSRCGATACSSSATPPAPGSERTWPSPSAGPTATTIGSPPTGGARSTTTGPRSTRR